ncbi:MAG: DPP IV N-terminal domain-containing protein [Gemmatimonadota bacterium]
MFRRSALLALAAAVLLVGLPRPAHADPIRFMRDPHVAHGKVVFSYVGDLWIADVSGANPVRLTAHIARDQAPRFSPDGRWVAFSSDRMGNMDVWVMPAAGGEPTQLTFESGGDGVEGWTPDGTGIVFTTSRGAFPFGSPLYVVPRAGGLPTALPMDMARAGSISPDGRFIAYNRNGLSSTRKGYKGNNSTDIFVQDVSTRAVRQLTDPDILTFREHVHDGAPMWGADGRIYYVSERDGIFNLWSMSAQGTDVQQVTRFRSGGVKYPSMSADGRTVAFTQEHELHLVEVPAGQARKVSIELRFDPKENLVEFVEVEDRAQGSAGAPDGKTVAVDFRGELFLVPVDPETGEKVQVTRSAWRERYASFSPDGKLLAYVSDEDGSEQYWIYDLATRERRKLTSHDSQKGGGYVWSPDSRRLAFEANNDLVEVDVATGRATRLGHNEAGGYALQQYSADGRWLLYRRSDERQDSDIHLFNIADRTEVNVTPNPAREGSAALTPDQRTVVFSSSRDGDTQLYAVSLARVTADPEDPLVRARTRPERSDSAAPTPISVAAAGIDRRVRQLTSGSESAGSFFLSADGATVYFTSRDDEGPALFSVPVDGGERKRVVAGSFPGLTPTPDRKFAFYTAGGGGAGSEVHRLTLQGNRKEQVEFSFTVPVDIRAEWEQIFEESWRVMKHRFYDADMHGVDWEAQKRAYKPLLEHVGTYEDVYDLANQMIGELNASHVGVSGPATRSMPRGYSTRYLGMELEPVDGRLRISHIYRDGPADREWLALEVGDYVLAIDEQPVDASTNYARILNHALNEYVPVRVAKSAGGQDAREVRIRTITSLGNLRYQDWVERNRDFVEQESDGRIAYVHIRSMNQASLAVFEEEINRYWDAQGIVVDIRFNGGGNTDQQIIDILERRPYEYWNSRWGARTWGRRPRQAIAGPKVMLINNRSGSDSEVTPQGFKDLGLGRVVGNPTAAAVIATGSYGLIHGGSIRTPGSLVVTYDPTQPHNYGINLENFGVEPDVFAENTPEDNLRGFDRELKAAVDEALRMLREGNYQFITEDGGRSGGG